MLLYIGIKALNENPEVELVFLDLNMPGNSFTERSYHARPKPSPLVSVFDSEGNFISSMKLDFQTIHENKTDPKQNDTDCEASNEFGFLLESSESRRKTFINACTPERKAKVIDFLKEHNIIWD